MASLLCCLNFNINLSEGVLNVDTLSKRAKQFLTLQKKIKLLLIRLEASLCQHSYPEYQHMTLVVSTTDRSSFRCH